MKWLKKLGKLEKQTIAIVVIVLIGCWLRFYRLKDLMMFIGDQGRDYLAARDFILTGKIPLVGIASSVPWLKQGSVFIWLVALCLKIGNFHPVTPAIMTAMMGSITIYLVYLLAETFLSQRLALLAALLMACSPLAVVHSRMPYHTSPIPLVTCLFLISINQLSKKKTNIFWSVLWVNLLAQLELTTSPLILLVPLVFWREKIKFEIKYLWIGLTAMLIPWLPKLIYDFTDGFRQTFGFVAWLGYRFLSFFGYSGRHTVSLTSLITVSLTIFNYWQKFISWGSRSIAIVAGLTIIIVIINRLRLAKKKPVKLTLFIILTFLGINLIAFYLHGGPSEAYFPVLFPVWALLLAWTASYCKKPVIVIFLVIVSIYNFNYLVSEDFIDRGPTLKQRLESVNFVINSSQESFRLENYQSVTRFPSYLDNYRYLAWWLGNPENPQSKNTFIIYEGKDSDFKPPMGTFVYQLSKIKVIKK